MHRITQFIGNRPYAIGVFGTVAAVLIIVLPMLLVSTDRKLVLSHARDNSANLTNIMAVDIENKNRFYDGQIQAIVNAAQDPRIWKLPPDIRDQLMFSGLPADTYVTSQHVLDANGRVIASKDTGPKGASLHIGDSEYFFALEHNPSLGLFISHPVRSRLTGKPMIALARRINKPDGSFNGVVVLEVRIEFMERLFDQLNTDASGGVTMALGDGTILARRPYRDSDVGVNINYLPVMHEIAKSETGSTIGTDRDGVIRLISWRHLRYLPIVVIAGPPLDTALANWRREARITASVAIISALVIGIGSWLLAFTLRDKLRAEQELTRLASIDPLTKVNNRRAFDERFRQEWGRACRDRTSISALFADIDHFKRFNDTYGHAAGDEVLVSVARCIASVARRPTDIVGRYGGEEFTIILPDTDQQGAIAVAESIRQEVLDLGAINEGSATGRITVSVGCATYHPTSGDHLEELLAGADRQMYLAKSAGRNQVKSIAVAELPVAAKSLPQLR